MKELTQSYTDIYGNTYPAAVVIAHQISYSSADSKQTSATIEEGVHLHY